MERRCWARAVGRRCSAAGSGLAPARWPADELDDRRSCGPDPLPPDPANALDGLLGQLAAVLPEGAIERTDDGARLEPDLVSTDAERFADLVGQSQDAGVAGDLPARGRLPRRGTRPLARRCPRRRAGHAAPGGRGRAPGGRATGSTRGPLRPGSPAGPAPGAGQGRTPTGRRAPDPRAAVGAAHRRLSTAAVAARRRSPCTPRRASGSPTSSASSPAWPSSSWRQASCATGRNRAASRRRTGAGAATPACADPAAHHDDVRPRRAASRDRHRAGRPEVRLVTLTGIGGSGKSRVATLVASDGRGAFTDVVYLQVTEASPGQIS